MAKKITHQQIIGARGEAFVSELTNSMGFMFSRYGPLEAGIDGLLEIRDTVSGTVTGKLIAVQIKTKNTGSYSHENNNGFTYLLAQEDLDYWNSCNLPVIVVLVHLERQIAFWKPVSNQRHLLIDKKEDIFDENAREQIAELSITKEDYGISIPLPRIDENGYLNLLEVLLPTQIYLASTRKQQFISREILSHEPNPPSDWVIHGGQFISFHDPHGGPLMRILHGDSIRSIKTAKLHLSNFDVHENMIIELLRRTLGVQLEKRLAYNRKQNLFYFIAHNTNVERSYKYNSLRNKTSATVVKKYSRNGVLEYVRHHAFLPRFWKMFEKWFMSITPTYHFTQDGLRPDKYAGVRLSQKKKLEFNSAIRGQFIMWSHLLTNNDGHSSLFGVDSSKPPDLLQFKVVTPLRLSRGVPDELWRATDANESVDTTQGVFTL